MKHLLTALFFVSSVVSASALTPADLAPDALVGKTLTFHYETGEAPFATSGSWTVNFGPSPGNVFTKTRITGDATNTTGTWSFNQVFSDMYEYTIVHYLAGRPDGILTLWVSGGEGRYEVFLDGVFGNSQTGGFTIGAVAPKDPEIAIEQPAGSDLTDGVSKKSFGTVKVGKAGTPKTFVIRNTGGARLTGLAISKKGKNKGDFIITPLKTKGIADGGNAKFKVTFQPQSKGTKNAILSIVSNDKNESPFTIQLTGEGAR
jgi:Abnormal spindle-like microcephaly-assoc'd, ASPM-SPD-2-Hydin